MKEKMTFEMTRRGFLGTALGGAAALAAGPAAAQAKTLNILSHRVHQAVLMPEGGEDLLAGWKSAQDADAVFTTFDSNPLMDRLFREASLGSTDYGVGYMVDNRPTSEIASLFEPLDGFQKDDPIEDFGDIAPGLVQGMTVDGNLVGIPVRHATQGLFYNEALLEEAGISAPPTTLEELVEQAGKLTFTSSAGTPVTGMILASDLAVFPVMFARAFGGDFITKDFQLVPDPEAMEKGLDTLRGMFEAGALPRSYATTKNDDMVTWIQQGRAAFTVLPFARNAQLNNPEQSKYPGKIKAVAFPVRRACRRHTDGGSPAWAILCRRAPATNACLVVHQGCRASVYHGHGAQWQRPREVSSYADPALIEEPGCRGRSQGVATARAPLPPLPRSCAGAATMLERSSLP